MPEDGTVTGACAAFTISLFLTHLFSRQSQELLLSEMRSRSTGSPGSPITCTGFAMNSANSASLNSRTWNGGRFSLLAIPVLAICRSTSASAQLLIVLLQHDQRIRLSIRQRIRCRPQGNRPNPVGGPGRDLRGSWAGAVPNPSATSPFLPLITRAVAAGAAWRVRRRGRAGVNL